MTLKIGISDMRKLSDTSVDSSKVTKETVEKGSPIFYYAAGDKSPLANLIWDTLVKPNLKCGDGNCEKIDFYDVMNMSREYSEGPIGSCACHNCDSTMCGGLGWYVSIRDTPEYRKILGEYGGK